MRRSDLRRPHTGRRRNAAARQAILDAAARLLAQPDGLAVTVEAIAAAAGVGKQTIYRWWPSKGAILLEAMAERARQTASIPDTGVLLRDLETFFTATFHGAASPPAAALLRAVMAEAQRDPHIAQLLQEFTRGRRHTLREILDRGRDRGDLPIDADLELMVDQAYGVLWYRLMVGHAPLTADLATRLARSLCARCPSVRGES